MISLPVLGEGHKQDPIQLIFLLESWHSRSSVSMAPCSCFSKSQIYSPPREDLMESMTIQHGVLHPGHQTWPDNLSFKLRHFKEGLEELTIDRRKRYTEVVLERLGWMVPLLTCLLSSTVFFKVCPVWNTKTLVILPPPPLSWQLTVYISITMVRARNLNNYLYLFFYCPLASLLCVWEAFCPVITPQDPQI